MIRLITAIFRHPPKPPRPHILEVRDENTARIRAERNTTRGMDQHEVTAIAEMRRKLEGRK